MRIFLDVDGVLANFVGASCKLFGHTYEAVDVYAYFKPVLGLTSREFWDRIKTHSDEEGSYWRGIEPYPWCHELHRFCKSLAPTTLLTAPPNTNRDDKRCMLLGRTDWIHEQFGHEFDEYYIGILKDRIASPGAVLVDDLDHNVDPWVAAGGRAVLFPHRWNANRHLVGQVDPLEYVKSELLRISQELKE